MSAEEGEDVVPLTSDALLEAYANGCFPMAENRNDPTLSFYFPERRGIFPLDGFHVSKSLRRVILKNIFEVKVDTDYKGVIEHCRNRPETWISDWIVDLYGDLFDKGHAHTVECWKDGKLVGGLYGVSLKGVFFGESMFSLQTDASKVALFHLIERLKAGGFKLLDAQFQTPHLKSLGAIEISCDDYMELLEKALKVEAVF